MGFKLYLKDLEEIIYESGIQQHKIDCAGTGDFQSEFGYKKISGWYKDIALDNFRISYCSGSFDGKTTVFFDFNDETIEMCFNLQGHSSTSMSSFSKKHSIKPNSHNIFYGNDLRGKVVFKSQKVFIFEINLKRSFFEQYLPSSGQFDVFKEMILKEESGSMSRHNHPITPEMFSIINEIINCPWKDEYRKMFLEAKVMELLLLQLNQMQQCKISFANRKTPKKIIDKMYLAQNVIMGNLHDPLSLSDLARIVNTNECTLKKEFKNVFGNTVFGYMRDVKLEKAKNMLLIQNLSVKEISGITGYKNPQHFSIAFKRKFGLNPSRFKRDGI